MSVGAEGFSIASLHRAGFSHAGPFFFFLEAKTELKGRYSLHRSEISSPRFRSRSMTISQCCAHSSIWRM
jgi:hypothetical protein